MSEVGTIFDIKKFAIHDGPGIRTTVFFKGCPLNCLWCHNPESRCPEPERRPVQRTSATSSPDGSRREITIGSRVTVDEVMDRISKDEIFYDQSGGGVTFSGGEPLMQMEFLAALLEESRAAGFHTAVDTSGYADSADFDRIGDLVDLFLYDLKIMDDERHVQYTGVSNESILENLTLLGRKGSKVVIRIPLVPGITDSEENLRAVVAFLKPLTDIRRISLLPYNKLGEDKTKRFQLCRCKHQWRSYTDEELDRTRTWLQSFGYEVKTGG